MKPDFYKATSLARELLNRNPTYKQYRPIYFTLLLKDLGLQVVFKDNLENEALLNPEQKTIFILNDQKPMLRKFFSIAHEIGHWVLHTRDKPRPRITEYRYLSPLEKMEEQEANAFAAELLMPFKEVATCIFYGYDPAKLADFFNVSYEFAAHRYNFVKTMGLY
ncbi:ImmA/IrrE family metallo-endopeptidase [Helicobacter vulpis]|uniref:ImmA/IrrE family metallo-endopeptidase n=1 Tax=Helicobacter vulpis TaxID=2316076 RepID=UPI000EB48419|nr:ImmA/IrrE family metallo-endopeptidase [Helicobacter vulpis]